MHLNKELKYIFFSLKKYIDRENHEKYSPYQELKNDFRYINYLHWSHFINTSVDYVDTHLVVPELYNDSVIFFSKLKTNNTNNNIGRVYENA